MGLTKITFGLTGDQQVSRGILMTAAEAQDMREPLDSMADQILAAIAEQFATEGKSGLGSKWAPLTEPYRTLKQAAVGPKPILVRKGGMKGALLNKRVAVRVTPTRMVYAPKSSYAHFHQDGTSRMAQRKIVALTTAQKREAVDRTFAAWLHKIRKEAMSDGA